MNNLSKYLQLLILILWIINVATALPMPTFPIVHGQVNGLLSAGKATSIKPTEWFTATIQAVEKGKKKKKKKDASYIKCSQSQSQLGSQTKTITITVTITTMITNAKYKQMRSKSQPVTITTFYDHEQEHEHDWKGISPSNAIFPWAHCV